jgi:PAS domain S-box-containing protein
MSFDIELATKILEFIIAAVPVLGLLYGGWKMIIKPIKDIVSKIEKLEKNHEIEVLPVIRSLSKEFSVNSGKSIMDRILRIDDNTRLAELRSKLIASNLMTASMLEFDRMGNLVWCNKAFNELTGLETDKLLGRGWFMCVEEDDRQHVIDLWNASIVQDVPFESQFNLKNQHTGKIQDVKCQIFPHKSITNEKINILGYYGIMTS